MDPESIKSVFALFDCFRAILYELLIARLIDLVYQSDAYGPPGILVTGENGIYFRGIDEICQILRGTKTLFGNGEYKKTNFDLGEKGTNQFIS